MQDKLKQVSKAIAEKKACRQELQSAQKRACATVIEQESVLSGELIAGHGGDAAIATVTCERARSR